MRDTKRRAKGIPLALALVLIVGVWPYLYALPLWPMSRDAVLWILRGAPSDPGWASWVFTTRHFGVAYRPATALSYTLNHWVGGFDPLIYRLTDLGLHVLCAVFVYLLYRRLVPTLARWGGLVAAGLFLAHPVADEVVPHLARRSYSLATLFALAAVWVLCPGESSSAASPNGRRVWARSTVGGLLLTCALLSNEVAYVTVPIVPLVVFVRLGRRSDRWHALIATCLVPLALAAGTLLARLAFVGGLGGYPAGTRAPERLLAFARATWETLGALAPIRDSPARHIPVILLLVALSVGLYYVWRAGRDTSRVTGVLFLWLVGFTLFFVPLNVWFPRQIYAALPALALFVAVVLAETTLGHARDPKRLAAHLVPQLLLVGWIVAHSPIVHGADPMRVRGWQATDRLLRDLHRELQTLQEPAVVRLVLPHYRRPVVFAYRARDWTGQTPLAAQHPVLWAQALQGRRQLAIEGLLLFEQDPLEPSAPPEFRLVDDRPALLLPPDRVYHRLNPALRIEPASGSDVLWLDAPDPAPGVPTYVYYHDGALGRLVRLAGSD